MKQKYDQEPGHQHRYDVEVSSFSSKEINEKYNGKAVNLTEKIGSPILLKAESSLPATPGIDKFKSSRKAIKPLQEKRKDNQVKKIHGNDGMVKDESDKKEETCGHYACKERLCYELISYDESEIRIIKCCIMSGLLMALIISCIFTSISILLIEDQPNIVMPLIHLHDYCKIVFD